MEEIDCHISATRKKGKPKFPFNFKHLNTYGGGQLTYIATGFN